jgi:hypothetical protein
MAARADRRRSIRNEISGSTARAVVQAGNIEGSVVLVGPPSPTTRAELGEIADQLAQVVAARWRREENRRRIQDPVPLPVRWQAAREDLTDHWDNIMRVPAGRTAGVPDLRGRLDQITDIYARIRSGRLVILGRAGSGKTILALRFVLDLLEARAAGGPVPVIFSIGSWNPAEALEDWLEGQLIRDHPGLTATVGPNRRTLAAVLVGERLVLPVLDGFDEIADGLHQAALQELSATTMPLVLTSRPDEYEAAAARTRGLTLAAAIELADLTLVNLEEYLPRTTPRLSPLGVREAVTTKWSPVLTKLRQEPGSPAAVNLARVLTTPLMVTLARTVYSDTPERSPAMLLDDDRFGTTHALEDHLLGSFVPSVYRERTGSGRWDPGRAQDWLGFLAGHLHRLGTRDLAWWELGTAVRRPVRATLIAVMAAWPSASSPRSGTCRSTWSPPTTGCCSPCGAASSSGSCSDWSTWSQNTTRRSNRRRCASGSSAATGSCAPGSPRNSPGAPGAGPPSPW